MSSYWQYLNTLPDLKPAWDLEAPHDWPPSNPGLSHDLSTQNQPSLLSLSDPEELSFGFSFSGPSA